MRMRQIGWYATLLLAVVVIGCSGPGAQAVDPVRVLRQAGQAMAGLRSVTADVKFGPGITLQGLTLTSATSKIAVPGASDTVFKVKQGDFLLDVRIVTTGGHVYIRLPFAQFTELSPTQARELPDLSALFDRRAGLPSVLTAGRSTTALGEEQAGGVNCDRVGTTYTASQVGQLLSGRQPAGDIHATVWVGQSDHYVRRVVLSGPLVDAGKVVQVQVDLRDFNQPVAVATPVAA